jgi:Fur family ferric uptake transcriptional regulator
MKPHRTTKQKSIILEILRSSGRPIAAPDILAAAQAKVANINKTTIYRTLDRLVEDGTVEAIMLHEGVVHYELREESDCGHHHHHFVCSECEKIFCVDGCVSSFEILLPKGFKLLSHDVTLRGLCRGCAK